MGTSAAYSAPPSWGDLKGDVTRDARAGTLQPETAHSLLGSFIQHNGGAKAISRASGGGTVAKGQSARMIGGRLGSFVSDVAKEGLEETLRKQGWNDLVGRPVPEVLAALIDRLGGNASSLDDVDARSALSRLQDQYFGGVTSIDDLQSRLSAQIDNLDSLLSDFFGFYLYEVFCRVFFERLVQRVGDVRAHSFLEQIEDFIRATLRNRAGADIANIDWAHEQGAELIRDIMEATLSVFGG